MFCNFKYLYYFVLFKHSIDRHVVIRNNYIPIHGMVDSYNIYLTCFTYLMFKLIQPPENTKDLDKPYLYEVIHIMFCYYFIFLLNTIIIEKNDSMESYLNVRKNAKISSNLIKCIYL